MGAFLSMWTAARLHGRLRKMIRAWPCKQVSSNSPDAQGVSRDHFTQRDGQVSSLRSSVRLTWSGLGSICGDSKQKKRSRICICKWEKGTESLLFFTCCLPQSTEVEAGSGTRECMQRAVRPTPREPLARPGCSASALRSQFLHSLEELPGKSKTKC